MKYNLILGDCLIELKNLPNESIDLCITSPPYEDLKNYKGLKNRTGNEYLEWLIEIGKEINRVLKPNGSFILNIGDKIQKNHERSLLIPKLIIKMVEEANFHYIEDYIWNKKKMLPVKSKYRATNIYEHCLWFSKTMNFTFNMDDVRRPYAESSKKRFKSPVLTRWTRDEDKEYLEYNEWKSNPKGALPKNILDIDYPSSKTEDFSNILNIISEILTDKQWLDDMNYKNEKFDIKDLPKLLNEISKYAISHNYAPQDILEMINKVYPNNMLSISSEVQNKYHCAVYPEELVSWFIRAGSNVGDTILDPFSGSGTTMKVAKDLQRNGIGIEINQDYYNLIKERLNIES